jgi:hypothetical protein
MKRANCVVGLPKFADATEVASELHAALNAQITHALQSIARFANDFRGRKPVSTQHVKNKVKRRIVDVRHFQRQTSKVNLKRQSSS